MKVLHATSELHPYSKSGGLADMVGALTKSLASPQNEIGVVTPLYRGIRERFPALAPLGSDLSLPLGSGSERANVWTLQPLPNLTVYFIDHPGFYDRTGLYQEGGVDYPDNAARFIFFSKCVAHLALSLPWQPELVHVHDWQAGLVPLMLQHQGRLDSRKIPRTCLTIHNLAYQGLFPGSAYDLTNLPRDYFHMFAAEFYGMLNCLKAGLEFSDLLTTVSPRYAREITTEEFGYGLDGVLRRRRDVLFGILNGVDYDEWKTENNPFLTRSYSADNMQGKSEQKMDLQKEMHLPVAPDVPLFATITRLADQKGVDIQLGALEEMLASPMQFVLLGTGSAHFEKAYVSLARRFPKRISVKIGFDQPLSHRIEAGADFFLMPSRFEPCGLNQMYSLRYGTIPIIRATGGLDDSIVDLLENEEIATGIKFWKYSVRALAKSIRKALVLYDTPELFQQYRYHAMMADFSWDRTSLEYLRCYEQALVLI